MGSNCHWISRGGIFNQCYSFMTPTAEMSLMISSCGAGTDPPCWVQSLISTNIYFQTLYEKLLKHCIITFGSRCQPQWCEMLTVVLLLPFENPCYFYARQCGQQIFFFASLLLQKHREKKTFHLSSNLAFLTSLCFRHQQPEGKMTTSDCN